MKKIVSLFCFLGMAAFAYASTHVDKDGVWRWNSDGSEVRIWGVNYYPPFAVDHHVIKSNGWDVRKIIDEDLEDMALLGINGICIIGHGSSNPLAVKNAIRVAAECVRFDLNGKILAMLDESGEIARQKRGEK